LRAIRLTVAECFGSGDVDPEVHAPDPPEGSGPGLEAREVGGYDGADTDETVERDGSAHEDDEPSHDHESRAVWL
jgi:hypothetical protein